jgi:hypothetical protein
MPRDLASIESVQHLFKKVENCFNYEQDSRGKTYHKLELIWKLDKRQAHLQDPTKANVTLEQVCKTCGQSYRIVGIPLSRPDVMRRYLKEVPELKEFIK